MKKIVSILITVLVMISVVCFAGTALAEEAADPSALQAVLTRTESYAAEDYTPESYSPLASLYELYQPQAETMSDQAAIDSATAQLLEAISGLKAYLKLSVSCDAQANIGVSYGETTGAVGTYTVVFGTPVTVTAPVLENSTFAGWFETVSKRVLSADSTYTFNMSANTSLKALYRTNDKAVLTFKSVSGQVFASFEKTAEEWANYASLDEFVPASVPFRYGYTNGVWNVQNDALTSLIQGESVTVIPSYDAEEMREWAVPQAADEVVLKLHYRYDSDAVIGSFVMKAAVPQSIVPDSVGMLFYYKKADAFNPSFDVNINNKMLVSRFNDLAKDTYITNMKKIDRYSWAVRGYITYLENGELKTVYSNQVNVVATEDIHEWQAMPDVPATCTEDGLTGGSYCDICGSQSGEQTAVPALGHDYEAVVTAATCTDGGYTTYTCTRCGDSYTDNQTDALGHDFGDWAVTTEPTCTENGTETRTCSRCDATETQPVAPLGHDYETVVTAPTCTANGYTTYTCTRCGDSYTDNQTDALGHSFGAWTVTTAPTATTAGEQTRTCSRCDATETQAIPALNIVVKLPNVEDYLYRAGTANNIALGSLFTAYDANTAIDSSKVTVTVENVAGTAAGAFTANTSDWTAATVKLSGTGVVKLTVKHNGYTSATLYLEAVAGTNYAAGATLANITSNNAVLLGDVNCTKITINNKKTLYGNGFSVTDTRTDFSGAANAYITMSGGGSIDNAKLLGYVYPSAVTSGQTNQYYAPGIWIIGDANIFNSYVSETKNAVQIDSGTVYFENSTFAGGAIANIDIGGGDVMLKNCVTQTSDRGGLKGLGIRPKTASCKIHLLGTFTQYNYLKKSDLPSTYSSILNSIYNDSTYAYTYSGSTYLNMGIFFVTDSGSITAAQAAAAVDDQTGNDYGYVEKTVTSLTGTIYTLKTASATPALLSAPAYDETVNGQYPIPPTPTFDYTTKNYIAKTEGSNRYCYYDSTTESVQISFDKENTSSAFTWDPMILTPAKNGNTLGYTVTMNNTDYTNGTITFTESGDYQVVYTYTDPYNYTLNGAAFSKTYTKTVNISVTAVEPDDVTYYASFTYDGAAGNYAAKKVIGTDSKTYVMPDVSSTSTTIGSTTVAGQTVYYPIVTVNPTSSNGNTAYSSGKGYYFAPVFSELHIIDYNQETGAQQYEYSKSTSTWPHGNSATTGPNTAYFTCASGEKTWSGTSPYARSMNSQYYKYAKNNLGVCYTSNDIEKDNTASNHLVQYHYVSNDGTTYYYYIYYKFGAMTYSSCVTDGTLVTMADGSQKAIEDVKVGDMVMTWSMWRGCYEAQPVVLHWYHGTDEWRVLTLHFSDGTEVRTIKEHGFFDTDKNTYAYITEDNVASYIGDKFIKQNADGTNTEVTLTDYAVTHENVGSYSIQTAYNENFIVENMLSMTGEDYTGRFEYFAIGDGMKYDEAQMQADIERYGLYTYEEFADYLTPEQFDMFNGAYFKVLVGKGVFTHEDIFRIISDNLS